MKVLIVYGTTEGHTATIAETIREAIEGRGHEVLLVRAGDRPARIRDDVDGVVVGASVHKTKHQPEIERFVVGNRDRLSELPSAFFQVCLAAADRSPESVQQTQALVDEFVASTGWQPAMVETFAGKLAWSQYDFFTRLLMKLVLRALHRPAEERDTAHDTDYTDYDQVRRFAREYSARLPVARGGAAAPRGLRESDARSEL